MLTTFRRHLSAAAIAALFVSTLALPASAHHGPPYDDGPEHTFGEMVDYPLVFPVQGDYQFGHDGYYDWRCCDPGEIHHAQDLMADKGTPIVAAAGGTVVWTGSRCCSVFIRHDDGWETWYIHMNNDTPGTDDGLGWGIAPGIERGTRVQTGQLIGWVGDSGNAENTPPHLHFELIDPNDTIVNPYEALRSAERRAATTCDGYVATHLDDDDDGLIEGTDGDDVIVGGPGADRIDGLGGNDVICGRGGDDVLVGGPGADRVWGGDGDDIIVGAEGDDALSGGNGDDVISGGPGSDWLDGGAGSDGVRGHAGDDTLLGGVGRDRLLAGHGDDLVDPGEGIDVVGAGSGRDRILAAPGVNRVHGGRGVDTIDYAQASGIIVDLTAGVGSATGNERLTSIERVLGSPGDDIIVGDERRNALLGNDGDDRLTGMGGADRLIGGRGTDTAFGDGNDACRVEVPIDCA